jgi:hypothetical protein
MEELLAAIDSIREKRREGKKSTVDRIGRAICFFQTKKYMHVILRPSRVSWRDGYHFFGPGLRG